MSGLLSRLELYGQQLNQDLNVLKRPFDTTEMHESLYQLIPLLDRWQTTIKEEAGAGNIRNLTSIKVALQQLQLALVREQDKLNAHTKDLVVIAERVKHIREDSLLKAIPHDSILQENYLSKYHTLERKSKLVDSTVSAQLRGVGILQAEVATTIFQSDEMEAEITEKVDQFQRRFFSADTRPIWAPSNFDDTRGLGFVILNGLTKNLALSLMYILTSWGMLLFSFVLAIGLFFLNRFNLKRVIASGRREILSNLHFLRRSNLRAVLLIFFMITPFLLSNPPVGLVQIFWVLVTVTAVSLRRPDWPEGYQRLAWIFLFFFTAFTLDSFIMESVTAERYLLLLLNLGAVIFGWFFYKEVLKDKSRFHNLMDESILIFIIVNILALLANVSGRFNLSRALSNSSALSISLLLALQIIREIVMETLYLHAETHRERGFAGFLDFDARSDKYRKFLGVLTIILWLLSFAWSMSFYDRISNTVVGFLQKERNLGEFSFTFGSVLIFVAIIWASVLVERIISLVFKTEDSNFPGRRKSKSGSWVLFSKLGVYIVGFLLAFAAAGISMDRMAIVLGALSVGIGFGLQNIVNNLVSGIILAVEKPMEVGDVIELGNRMGTVKEIGFRSSQIATYDGSVIIVPNGDFISQQLINWTHSNNNYRRVDLVIGVPYGTDLEKAKTIVMAILESHKEVARYPAPLVLVHQFGSSSVDLRALFWTAEFDKWVGLRSDVLQQIYQRFGESGIEIPFPQQDLHIRSIDPTAAEALKGKTS